MVNRFKPDQVGWTVYQRSEVSFHIYKGTQTDSDGLTFVLDRDMAMAIAKKEIEKAWERKNIKKEEESW